MYEIISFFRAIFNIYSDGIQIFFRGLILYLSLYITAENPKQLQVYLRRPAAETRVTHVHTLGCE